MHEQDLIHNLDAIVNTVVQHIREDSANIEFKNVKTNYYVKSHGECYDICDKDTNKVVYGNIIDIDFVRAIMYSLLKYKKSHIDELLLLEKQYNKHVNDMLFYVNAFKQTKDSHQRGVLEDRFEVSKHAALGVKEKLKMANSIFDK